MAGQRPEQSERSMRSLLGTAGKKRWAAARRREQADRLDAEAAVLQKQYDDYRASVERAARKRAS